jgi:hypothetical protein
MSKSELQKVLEAKKKAKHFLYQKCWPKESPDKPLLVIYAPNSSSAKNMMFQVMEGCLVLSCNVIVISETEPGDFAKHPSGKFSWVNPESGRNQPKLEEYLQAADMALLFEEHLMEIKHLMKKGVVIIGHEKSPLLQNYHPNEETGNSFTFSAWNPWDVFKALVRAHETYRFPYDWQNIMRGMLKPM